MWKKGHADSMPRRGLAVPCNRCKESTDIVDLAQFRLSFLETPDAAESRTCMYTAVLCLACRAKVLAFMEEKIT